MQRQVIVIAVVIGRFEGHQLRGSVRHELADLGPFVRRALPGLTVVRYAVRNGAARRPQDAKQQQPPGDAGSPPTRRHSPNKAASCLIRQGRMSTGCRNRPRIYFTVCKRKLVFLHAESCMSVRVAVLFACLLGVALPVRAAVAHPKLVSASPAANASVEQSPTMISATFNEALTLSLSKLTLIDAAQRAIPLEATKAAEGDPKTLTARVTVALKPGRYTAKWQAAGADGHPMRGEFTFLVVAPSGAGPSPKPPAR